MNRYDVPKEAYIVDSVGEDEDPVKLTHYKPVVYTEEIKFGPINITDRQIQDSGGRLNWGQLIPPSIDACIRKQEEGIIKAFGAPILLRGNKEIPYPEYCRIPFDTVQGGNDPIAQANPTFAQLTAAPGAGLTPYKLNLATMIMLTNGVPIGTPIYCFCSHYQYNQLKTHSRMENYDFNTERALTIDQLKPYGAITGFYATDNMPMLNSMGPNANGGTIAADYAPANAPGNRTDWFERVYVVAAPYMGIFQEMEWRTKLSEYHRGFGTTFRVHGLYGYSRTEDAATVCIECFSNRPKIINTNVREG
jgi:hypothetical protein